MTSGHHRQVIESEEMAFDGQLQRSLMLEIAYRVDSRGVLRFTQSEIADVMLVSRPTVAREMAKLVDKGYLTHVRPGRYAIPFPQQHQDSPTAKAKDAPTIVEVELLDHARLEEMQARVTAGEYERLPGLTPDKDKIIVTFHRL